MRHAGPKWPADLCAGVQTTDQASNRFPFTLKTLQWSFTGLGPSVEQIIVKCWMPV